MASENATSRTGTRTQLPPRLLPILYIACGHVALALAFGAVAIDPRGVAGFFYHSRMLAIVHLITLGWITSSILGSIYIVGPVALGLRLPATWRDYTAFAFVAIGIVGMVAHFWIQEYPGMAWSAATVGAGIAFAGTHVLWRLPESRLSKSVATHIVLAFVNILGAATLGVLIGFDKVYHFLPGVPLSNVFAHAHLAAIGWASMMVVGVSYRLLPIVLPAQAPVGPRLWLTAVLLETGIIALVVTLLIHASYLWIPAGVILVGFGIFLSQVIWMLRHPRTSPPALRHPDPAVLHAAAAFVSLTIAAGLGLWLASANLSTTTLRVAMAYGVFGLVGFLAQLVVGMQARLLPLFAWYWAFANTEYRGPVRSPHEMAWHGGQELVFVMWLFGVPALAGGLAFDAVPFVRAAGWTLLVATFLDTLNVVRILRHGFVRPKPLMDSEAHRYGT